MDVAGRQLTIESGRVAKQADGAVLVQMADTVVLVTAVTAKAPRAGVDFLPLTVDYQERAYAAGKIPGGFFKREGRPAEREILSGRLIDRPLRPLPEAVLPRDPGHRVGPSGRPEQRDGLSRDHRRVRGAVDLVLAVQGPSRGFGSGGWTAGSWLPPPWPSWCRAH
jgi:hypothetical protein